MRALILYSTESRLQKAASALAHALENNEWQVQLLEAAGSGPINVIPFDLVCVGSPEVADAITRCNHLDGKRTIAFVTPKPFGTDKSLKTLMGLLEAQGSNVFDFLAIGSSADAQAIAQRAK